MAQNTEPAAGDGFQFDSSDSTVEPAPADPLLAAILRDDSAALEAALLPVTQAHEALCQAARSGQDQAVQTLLHHNINPECRDSAGLTPLLLAVQSDRFSVVEYLLLTGVSTSLSSLLGESPLHMAVQHRSLVSLNLLLQTPRIEVDARDVFGRTPLMTAAAYNDTSTISLLLSTGANVQAINHQGRNSLHYSSRLGHCEGTTALLAGGADVDARDLAGETPLMLAVHQRHIDIVRQLVQVQCHVNLRDVWAQTALHHAAAAGCVPALQSLSSPHANMDSCDVDQMTPLVVACYNRQVEAAEFLIHHGADVDKQDSRCRSALWWAVEHDLISVAKLLIQHNCPVNGHGEFIDAASTRCLYSPFELACVRGRRELVPILALAGANLKSVTGWLRRGRVPAGLTQQLANWLAEKERCAEPLTHICRRSIRESWGSKGFGLRVHAMHQLDEDDRDFLLMTELNEI